MISFVATADDVGRLRFGVSPLGEAVFSIRMMGSATKRLPHQRWINEVRPKLGGVDFRPVRALIPPTGYVPDLLTPPPVAGQADFDANLQVVRSVNPQKLIDEIAWMMIDPRTPSRWKTAMAPIHRQMLGEPDGNASFASGETGRHESTGNAHDCGAPKRQPSSPGSRTVPVRRTVPGARTA